MKTLAFDKIRTDGGTQPRASIDADTVASYVEAIQSGAEFPPVVVFYDGEDYWLADGFHRVRAANDAGQSRIKVEIEQGTQRDAVLYSVGANATHGMPRTNADKRRAVLVLLKDEEWTKKSDRWIAEQAAVSNHFVAKLRESATGNTPSSPKPREGRDGKTRRPPRRPGRPRSSPPAATWTNGAATSSDEEQEPIAEEPDDEWVEGAAVHECDEQIRNVYRAWPRGRLSSFLAVLTKWARNVEAEIDEYGRATGPDA
jgi:hypothetical protein